MFGYFRVGAAVPTVGVADIQHNVETIIRHIRSAAHEVAHLLVFPELCLPGYTCGDLFLQTSMIDGCEKAINDIALATKDLDPVVIIGAPVRFQNRLYNCAVVIHRGRIKGVIPKSVIPNYKEFYEKRWLTRSLPGVNHRFS